jgi:Cu(I)/Ag(I) efflux system membrane protein CusA/SilA
MIEHIIEWSVKNKFLVTISTLVIIAAGIYTMKNTAIDAIPDLSDVQVIIQTDYLGQTPEIVEQQVTYPLTTSMLSVPFAKTVRGYSFFGVSFVYVIFEDGTDMYWARSRVLEYLNAATAKLPNSVKPELGPDATGVGWVFQYSLQDSTGKNDLQQLRSIQDFYMKYELQTVKGVAEVASIGGFVKQYQIDVDPIKLRAQNISLSSVIKAVKASNITVGARLIEQAESEFMVTSNGYICSIDDLKKIVLKSTENGSVLLLDDIANIQFGPELRRGLIDSNGEGETVGGIVVMRYGENALDVIEATKKKLAALRAGLPEGVEILVEYDRSKLIKRAVSNVTTKLVEELIVVALISLIFLMHFRSAFVAIFTVPVGIFISLIIMRWLGLNANVMSLAGIGIAVGVMVDASIVMVENAHKKIEHGKAERNFHRESAILAAAKEVGPALFFSLLIVTLSFLPIFTLEQVEGRLFKPLAFTKTFAMGASAFLAITIIPVLMIFFIKGKIRSEEQNPVSRLFIKAYRPMLHWVLDHPKKVILGAGLILLLTIYPYSKLGSEFMPPLEEGDLLYMPTTLPGVSITKARELLQQTDRIIKSFPEVERVLGKVGRAETATDPAPLSMIETIIILKDPSDWRKGMTMKKLIDELNNAIQIPGLTNAWTMPIKTRTDMLATGIKTPVGIKVAGADLKTLEKIGKEIEAAIKKMPNTLSVISERVYGGNYLDIQINREAIARFGLSVAEVQQVISSAIGGMNVSESVEGLERYPINIRYPRELRDNIEALREISVQNSAGAHIPLGQVANFSFKDGPPAIKSENARLNAWIYVDIKDIDVGTYVSQAQKVVADEISLPSGYSIIWSGQFEYMQRAEARLKLVIPITIVIIFILLFLHFKNFYESGIIMATLPFAVVGSIWFMYILGFDMSIAVAVGFIAVTGLAAETGIVMQVYLHQAVNSFQARGEMNSISDLKRALSQGAVERVRPKLMTVATTLIGLIPMMFGDESGAAIMKRISAPMIGGMLSSTVLTLLVIPAIYLLYKKWDLKLKNKHIAKGS